MSNIQSTKGAKRQRWWLLKGPQKAGKTTTAASISKFWGKQSFLEDLFIVDADANGAESLAAHDAHCDSASLFEAPTISDKHKIMKEVVEHIKENPRITNVVFSGLSTLDYDIVGELKLAYPGDKFGLYDDVIAKWRGFFHHVRSLRSQIENVVLEAHTKAQSDLAAKDTVKKEASGETKGQKIILDVSGKTAGWLERQASLILPTFVTWKAGKKVYGVYPKGYPENNPLCPGGHRYGEALGSFEEPNLRKILNKIQGEANGK